MAVNRYRNGKGEIIGETKLSMSWFEFVCKTAWPFHSIRGEAFCLATGFKIYLPNGRCLTAKAETPEQQMLYAEHV